MVRVIQDVVTLLNQLIQTEYDTVEARRAAVTQVAGVDDGHHFTAMLADHRGHVDDLAVVVRNLGGEPLSHGDLRRLLAQGRPGVATVAGEHGALDALRRFEERTREAYEEAASLPGIPVDVHEVLERLLADERRHLSWLKTRRPPTLTRPDR